MGHMAEINDAELLRLHTFNSMSSNAVKSGKLSFLLKVPNLSNFKGMDLGNTLICFLVES